ncbi:MAG: glycoside hydrolase family 88 protein, partial [Oscillospiraceae bacterium]|nr:glycoside hydrolase family 88 protein [Oscillospiraceae bacterium]
RYQKALDELIGTIRSYPKNPDGGFWHKDIYPNQMWLDGLYMGGPIAAGYSKRYNQPGLLDNAIFQTILMERVTREGRTGLWCHAYDYSKSAPWADPITGMSPEFWGRAMGWVVVAVQQIASFMDTSHPQYDTICGIVRNLLTALCRYQTESGLWYQVVDKAGEPGNWPEISCSCLYTGALFMAIENGILSPDFLPYALNGYDGVINSLSWRGDDLIVGGVCIGTGVGDYAHYCARPTSENDLHGVGAFLIMCAQAHNHSR